jgi:hypothetical protein
LRAWLRPKSTTFVVELTLLCVTATLENDPAKETAKATEDISRKIETIQTDTRELVDAIGAIGGVTIAGVEEAAQSASHVAEGSSRIGTHGQ